MPHEYIVELLLGVWLLSGWWMRGAWVVALVFFGILASASLYLALVGQTNGGCFGRVAVNPWITLAIDVAALAALLLCRRSCLRLLQMTGCAGFPLG